MKYFIDKINSQQVGKLMSVFLFCAIVISACTEWDDHYDAKGNDSMTIYEVMSALPEYDYFVKALDITGYDKVLKGQDVYTVFIPAKEELKKVSQNDEGFKRLIGNHIILGKYYIREVADTMKVGALSGKHYSLFADEEGFKLSIRKDDFYSLRNLSDLQARNGVAHVIDGMIETVPNLQDLIKDLDPNKYSIFLNEYNRHDSINPEMEDLRLGLNEFGEVVRDTLPFWVYPAFNPGEESLDMTVIVPSDDAIEQQRMQLIQMNGGDATKISDYYYARMIRNQVLDGAFSRTQLASADTIETIGKQKVVGNKLKGLEAEQIASNGYLLTTNSLLYEPLAVDFIDSLVYEAEYSLGIDDHPRTIIYTTEQEPIILDDQSSGNKLLFGVGLNRGDRINLFIPDVFKGLYKVKLVYKQSDIGIVMSSEGRLISEFMDLETLVPEDLNNEGPVVLPNVEAGFVFHQESGYLNIQFDVLSGTFTSLMIDKIILVPVEY